MQQSNRVTQWLTIIYLFVYFSFPSLSFYSHTRTMKLSRAKDATNIDDSDVNDTDEDENDEQEFSDRESESERKSDAASSDKGNSIAQNVSTLCAQDPTPNSYEVICTLFVLSAYLFF